MSGRVPDSSVRTAQVAANAFTRVQVGLKENGRKSNNVFAALAFKSGRFIRLRRGGGFIIQETFNTSSNPDKIITIGPQSQRVFVKAKMYPFTPPTTGTYSFSTIDGATWDTVIALTNNSDDNIALSYNDDYNDTTYQSYMEASLIGGTTYRFYVGGHSETDHGSVTVKIIKI